MTLQKVTVGKGRRSTDQLITTTFTQERDGQWRERVTLQTPPRDNTTDTQRLRLLTARELGRSRR